MFVIFHVPNFDIFSISTFPNMSFKINRYELFRRDPNSFDGGLMLYSNEEIPHKFLNNHPIIPNVETICI